MKIRHSEIEIESGKPFANCKLGREKYARILTDIANSYANGFVLAINNKWGTGKTTFVRMWQQDLIDNKYKTVYFNAWENDFENNPLTALMGEMKTLTKETTEPKFKSTLKKAATLSKHVTPIIALAIADKYINTKEIKEAIVGVTKGLSDVFENDVNEYAKRKTSIQEFRSSLSTFIKDTCQNKPIIFIVDELDRCRPDYAVSILEQIKHFFSVPNIVFVLSIDKEQLGNAVRGVYGSDKIDADEYLRRFIDIEYSIPEPEDDEFYKYLFDYFRFDEFFNSKDRRQLRNTQNDTKNFFTICKLLFTNTSIPLRQQEKIFVLARLSLRTFKEYNDLIPFVYMFLIYIKVVHSNVYDKIRNKQLTLLQLQENILRIVKQNNNKETETNLMWLEAYMLNYYHNYINPRHNKQQFYEYDKDAGENILLIKSIISSTDDKYFLHIFERFDNERDESNLELGYFLNKIDLLENLK